MVTDRHLLEPSPALDEDAARRALRGQITRLERQLADALVTGFPFDAIDVVVPGRDGPRLLGLGELEELRDDLAARLQRARRALAVRAERQQAARAVLESMYADPRRHRFARVARADLGVPGCGSYEVRPRLGLVGMLMGWWHVKLSSGCPPAARGEPASYSSLQWAAAAASVQRSRRASASPRRRRLRPRARRPPRCGAAHRPRNVRSRPGAASRSAS
jgi:hypothetical protein